MNDITLTLLYWIPKIFFVVIFLIIGILSIRKKVMTRRFIFWIFILYFLEKYTEIWLRTLVSYYQTLDEGYTSLAYKFFLSSLRPAIESIITKEIVMLLIAGAVWVLLYIYAKRTNFKKLDSADVGVFAFGVLVSGWPNFLIYFLLVFFLALIGLLLSRVVRKRETMIVTPYFALAGIVIIFWGVELSKLVGLYAIR